MFRTFRRFFRPALAAALLLAAAGGAHAQRRASRYKKKTAPRPSGALLAPGRWVPSVRLALEELIDRKGNRAPGYSTQNPPAAVFVWEDVSAVGSIGEEAFYRLVGDAEFKFGKEFWDLIPPPFDRRAQAGFESFRRQPRVVWEKDPDYQMYRKAMFAAYKDLCEKWGRRRCSGWLAGLLAGFTEPEASDYMRRVLLEGLRQGPAWEAVRESAGDESPVNVRTGLAKIPEIEDLCRTLLKNGFDVWVLSSSNQWAAEGFSSVYGVDRTRVVGARCKVLNKKITSKILDPLPVGTGRTEAVVEFVGENPALIVGGGASDEGLLEYGGGARLLLDGGDVASKARAASRGWLIQPSFARAFMEPPK